MRVRGGLLGRKAVLKAVDGVSLELAAGATLGVVGESGCGKSTLGRAVLQLVPRSGGGVLWMGEEIAGIGSLAMQPRRCAAFTPSRAERRGAIMCVKCWPRSVCRRR